MNVALLAPRFHPQFDGVGDHAAHVTGALVRAGHDVLVVTESRDARPPCEIVRIERWNATGFERARRALAARRPDLVLVEYTPFNFGPRGFAPHALAALQRLRGGRVAAFMHEGFYRPNGTNPMPPLKAAFFGTRDAMLVASANATFAASDERLRGVAEAVPFLRSKLRVIPIGANVEPSPARRWAPAPGPPYRIVMFGVVAPRRRILLAIEAVALAARRGIAFELTVLGRIFDEAYAATCMSRAVELGIADRVRFTRERERSEVSETFLNAHLSLHALFEGTIASSGSLLATLAHGVPLLCVRTPRDERAFEDSAAFTSEEPEHILADALAIVTSPDGGRALGDRARAHYERDFSWDRIAERALEPAALAYRRPSHARA
jgi:glycosyltransferase involved in cell wall biosynthesis